MPDHPDPTLPPDEPVTVVGTHVLREDGRCSREGCAATRKSLVGDLLDNPCPWRPHA